MSDPAVAEHGRSEPVPDQRRRSGLLGDSAAVLGTYLLLGVVGGLLWWLLWDPAVFTKVDGNGSMGEAELQKLFNGDAWYTVIAAVGGLAAGFGLTVWRARDFVATTVLLLLGAGLAAAVMAWTGHTVGPGDPDAALESAKAGATVPVQLEVRAKAAYLVWPIASLVGALTVLWSPPKATDD